MNKWNSFTYLWQQKIITELISKRKFKKEGQISLLKSISHIGNKIIKKIKEEKSDRVVEKIEIRNFSEKPPPICQFWQFSAFLRVFRERSELFNKTEEKKSDIYFFQVL